MVDCWGGWCWANLLREAKSLEVQAGWLIVSMGWACKWGLDGNFKIERSSGGPLLWGWVGFEWDMVSQQKGVKPSWGVGDGAGGNIMMTLESYSGVWIWDPAEVTMRTRWD